ncbi:hypothetical protein LEMLEM_LOCUS27679, partial [Lemmus lemmus]
ALLGYSSKRVNIKIYHELSQAQREQSIKGVYNKKMQKHPGGGRLLQKLISAVAFSMSSVSKCRIISFQVQHAQNTMQKGSESKMIK